MARLVLATFVVLFTGRPDAAVISARFTEGYDPVGADPVAATLPAFAGDSTQDADSPGDVAATGDAVVEGECCGGSAAFQGSLSFSGTPVAEPTSLLLLGLGLALLAWSIKRNRRK